MQYVVRKIATAEAPGGNTETAAGRAVPPDPRQA
jgi:hypothetical protein